MHLQKKIGKSFHDHSFVTNLKTHAQWEESSDELEHVRLCLVMLFIQMKNHASILMSYMMRQF